MNNGKILQVRKVSNRAAKSVFFFFKLCKLFQKSLHYFWKKKDAFGAVERLLEKKTLENFSSILHYLKLFRLAIYSRYSLKAWGKMSIKRNTWEIFQCSALFETFRTCNIFSLFIKSVWKDVYKKNTWKIFQYSALFETFRPCNIFPLFIKSV